MRGPVRARASVPVRGLVRGRVRVLRPLVLVRVLRLRVLRAPRVRRLRRLRVRWRRRR